MSNQVRIIGGKYRGKKLSFPDAPGLRPTSDRIRETLFNWLMHDIQEAHCLDAFAGSGALGFEALSRGASRVILVEKEAKVFKQLQALAKDFNSPQLQLHHQDSYEYLQSTSEVFDLIFLDPPFNTNLLSQCIGLLEKSPCLPSGGLVYAESAQPLAPSSEHWLVLKSKKAGQVCYGLLQKR